MVRRTLHLVKTLAFLVTVGVTLQKGINELLHIYYGIFDRYRQNLIFGISVTRIPVPQYLDSVIFDSF
jgi:hypothetical protein